MGDLKYPEARVTDDSQSIGTLVYNRQWKVISIQHKGYKAIISTVINNAMHLSKQKIDSFLRQRCSSIQNMSRSLNHNVTVLHHPCRRLRCSLVIWYPLLSMNDSESPEPFPLANAVAGEPADQVISSLASIAVPHRRV